MFRHRLGSVALVVMSLACVRVAGASDSLDPIEPPVVLLPNYGRVMIGSQGGLEGNALVARAKAAEAAWFNPAGVALGKAPEIQGNASVYEFTTFSANTGETTVDSTTMNTLPVFVAASSHISERGAGEGRLAWGYCVVTPVNWHSSLDSFIEGEIDNGWNQITSQSNAGITTLAVGGNLGYATSPRFSAGVGGFLYMTDINLSRSRYDDWDYLDGDNYWTLSRNTSTSVSAMHLGLTAGLTAAPRKGTSFGLVVRSPGIGLSATGTHIENRVIADTDPLPGENAYEQISAREEDVPVTWKMPLEVVAGVAFEFGRDDQLELNVSYRHGAGDYEVFPSGFYLHRTVDDVGNHYSSDDTLVRSALTTTQQGTLNFSIGYRRYLSETSRLHAGFSTAFSPVRDSPEENIFNSLDLMSFTIGMSSLTENTMTTYGLIFQWGGGNVTLLDLSDYPYTHTSGDLSVMTVGLMLGASFKL